MGSSQPDVCSVSSVSGRRDVSMLIMQNRSANIFDETIVLPYGGDQKQVILLGSEHVAFY